MNIYESMNICITLDLRKPQALPREPAALALALGSFEGFSYSFGLPTQASVISCKL
jgi:hypothetical protein